MIEVALTRSHIKKLESFILNSTNGNLFILYKNIYILNNRNEFLIYKHFNVDLDKKILIRDNIDWYKTTFITNENIEDKIYLDSVSFPLNIYEKGIYLTHWRRGDSITLNANNIKITKKISDIFIDNKVSQIDKKYYPIVRNSKDEILWIPNLESNVITNSSATKQIFWIKN